MADGPVIQQSSAAALANGMTLRKLFAQLAAANLCERVEIPLVMMGYINPIMQYGIENFCDSCAAVGIDGIIIPDLPFADYLRDLKPHADHHNIHCINLITPETSEARIRQIDEQTSGFIYAVSTAATTGQQQEFNAQTIQYFRRLAGLNLKNPLLIGFGISNPQTLRAAQQNARGAIIGSAFIKLLETQPTIPQAVAKLLQNLGL